MPAIEINNLRKSYGKTEALKNVSFEVGDSELFGVIGPDGAGKTTLFRIITTLLLPGEGSATVLGMDSARDFKKIRRELGYMPGRFSLYEDLSVEENLTFFASIFKTSIEENYELVGDIYSQIEPFKKRKAGNLSGGMKQKLALSCALIHKPKILVLDEPTTGVDAVSRKEFWEMLKKLKAQGITIIVSTPYMDEAALCERVALMQKGKILNIDAPSKIVGEFSKELFAVKAADTYGLLRALKSFEFARTVYPFGESVHYTDVRDSAAAAEIVEYLKMAGLADAEAAKIQPGIEDTFMDLMDKE